MVAFSNYAYIARNLSPICTSIPAFLNGVIFLCMCLLIVSDQQEIGMLYGKSGCRLLLGHLGCNLKSQEALVWPNGGVLSLHIYSTTGLLSRGIGGRTMQNYLKAAFASFEASFSMVAPEFPPTYDARSDLTRRTSNHVYTRFDQAAIGTMDSTCRREIFHLLLAS